MRHPVASSQAHEISLSGQTVIVTGGGNGLGRAHALELARRGAAIVVNDVAGSAGEVRAADRVVAEIQDAGGRAVASYESVATAEGGESMVGLAREAFGSLEAVVHNAGVWRNVRFEDMTAEMLDPVLDVHLRGAFFVTVPAWRIFKANAYGRVVLTSSATGVFGRDAGSNYAAAKAGLIGLARALAIEGATSGIKVNCLLPMAATSTERRPMPPGVRERIASSLAVMEHRRQPERVSPLVAYLVSRECAVNGKAFSAAAGRYASVFTGVTAGWSSPTEPPATAEDIEAHLDSIEDDSSYIVPTSVFDEFDQIAAAIRASEST
jgi:NAD(P)-dependent dehydrogenase (short-subunit alcohol dehydrogenase family)